MQVIPGFIPVCSRQAARLRQGRPVCYKAGLSATRQACLLQGRPVCYKTGTEAGAFGLQLASRTSANWLREPAFECLSQHSQLASRTCLRVPQPAQPTGFENLPSRTSGSTANWLREPAFECLSQHSQLASRTCLREPQAGQAVQAEQAGQSIQVEQAVLLAA